MEYSKVRENYNIYKATFRELPKATQMFHSGLSWAGKCSGNINDNKTWGNISQSPTTPKDSGCFVSICSKLFCEVLCLVCLRQKLCPLKVLKAFKLAVTCLQLETVYIQVIKCWWFMCTCTCWQCTPSQFFMVFWMGEELVDWMGLFELPGLKPLPVDRLSAGVLDTLSAFS